MATKQSTVNSILTQMADAGVITAKKMFGEYGVYCDGKIVALVCDDRLYIKPTIAGEKFIGIVTEEEPYPGAKPYFLIAPEKWDDAAWLSQLIKVSAKELPAPKPKSPKSRQIKRSPPIS